MIKFPANLYSDVRIEDSFSTVIRFILGDLEELRVRTYRAAFIRVFDGARWYYSAVTDPGLIQSELDSLAELAAPDPLIDEHPVVRNFQENRGKFLTFADDPVSGVDEDAKVELVRSYFPSISGREKVKSWGGSYRDLVSVKHFLSSKGADVTFDTQTTGFAFGFGMVSGDRRLRESFFRGGTGFDELNDHQEAMNEKLDRSELFVDNSQPVEPGKYTVILSPFAAGIFAHESFGHKSEADFMVGDEAMLSEWSMGTKVGADILSIVDDGNEPGTGYAPFDDEGSKATKTWIIRDGILTGRLHSASTAADLRESLTGNARSVSFEFEPIPRMTTTYIAPGSKTKEELFGEVDRGIFVDTLNHGSGLSTFTLAPSMSYMIVDGKLADPVSVSVITGNVMETLGDITGLSNELELYSIPSGGCGKMDQAPLPVGFGGPYVLVRNMNVQ